VDPLGHHGHARAAASAHGFQVNCPVLIIQRIEQGRHDPDPVLPNGWPSVMTRIDVLRGLAGALVT
jgi:hypothetical protein